MRLSLQLSGPHACYCPSTVVLLCGYPDLVAVAEPVIVANLMRWKEFVALMLPVFWTPG